MGTSTNTPSFVFHGSERLTTTINVGPNVDLIHLHNPGNKTAKNVTITATGTNGFMTVSLDGQQFTQKVSLPEVQPGVRIPLWVNRDGVLGSTSSGNLSATGRFPQARPTQEKRQP